MSRHNEGFLEAISTRDRGVTASNLLFNPVNCTKFLKNVEATGNVVQASRLSRLVHRTVKNWIFRGQAEAEALSQQNDISDEPLSQYVVFYLDVCEAMEKRNKRLEGLIEDSAAGTEDRAPNWMAASFLLTQKLEGGEYGAKSATKPDQNIELTIRIEEVNGDDWRTAGRAVITNIENSEMIEVVDTSFKAITDGRDKTETN